MMRHLFLLFLFATVSTQLAFTQEAEHISTTFRLRLSPQGEKLSLIVDARNNPGSHDWDVSFDSTSNPHYVHEGMAFPIEEFINWLVASGKFEGETLIRFAVDFHEDNVRTQFIKRVVTENPKEGHTRLTQFDGLIIEEYKKQFSFQPDEIDLSSLESDSEESYGADLKFSGGENWVHSSEDGKLEFTTSTVYFVFKISAMEPTK